MGIGIPAEAFEKWLNDPNYNGDLSPDDYEKEGDIYWFYGDLPEWAYITNVGPFFIDTDGAVYGISMKASQKGDFIGNTTEF